MADYKKLVVREVRQGSEYIIVRFEDYATTLSLDKESLKKNFGIKWRHIYVGRVIFIQGKDGNEDYAMARPDAVKDMILAAEQ